MDHEHDALKPAFPLLDEVPQREGRFFPHLALDEVEVVAFAEGSHGEEAVFRHRAVEAVVEGNCLLGGDLKRIKIMEFTEWLTFKNLSIRDSAL